MNDGKRSVLITGATGNLGKVVVDTFLKDGYRVFVTVSPGKKSAEKNMEITELEADLTNEGQAEKVVEDIISSHGSIDAALLLVGGFAAGKIEETTGADMKKMLALNFDTAYFIARPVFSQMKKQRNGGRIIFVGSRPSLQAKDGKNFLGYALSKSLLFKLAEFLNADGASANVVTSVVVPSTIDTPANRQAMPDAKFESWVSPEEIAATMAFICSPENKSLRDPIFKLYGKA